MLHYILAQLTFPVIAAVDVAAVIPWKLLNCIGEESEDRQAMLGPIALGANNETIERIWNRLQSSNFPLKRDVAPTTHPFPLYQMFINVNGIPRPLSLSPLLNLMVPITEKMVDDDNVSIHLQLALLGQVWGLRQ
jgi:hypothetical protein